MRLKLIALFAGLLVSFSSLASVDHYNVQLYFGLSKPAGGAVSLDEWNTFQQEQIATVFEGFNVSDTVGYYLGKPERSKVVTIVTDGSDLNKIEAIAKEYDREFGQDSVMMVETKITKWDFISNN
ncbi:DUF3574 domain-containing protein [Dongshaea marina]|uniref:DUF3574 domain-containing protein n=1 Tax=Dongshaea marina TaxID=2047966 RepID=UPI00131EE48E|nr:DUF3574 domain-containing protein [Dongshaea marina]